MATPIEYVSGHLFVFGFWGFLSSCNYFKCNTASCPFSLRMEVKVVDSQRVAVSCLAEVVPVHCHDCPSRPKRETKREILRLLKFIKQHPADRVSEQFKEQHSFWNGVAKRQSKLFKNYLIDLAALKVYCIHHPGKSAKQLKIDCGLSMSQRAICNLVRRERQKNGQTTDIREMLLHKTHHVLGNDAEDIIVFGQTSSVQLLSQTSLIQGDGTFTCIVHPFTQLYVFHALLANGVSLPLLYCLVKGKNEAIYRRLLSLVERIANERGRTILQRPVTLMVDFKIAFIKAAKMYQAGRSIMCCCFHFVANIKKKARVVIEELKKKFGAGSAEVRMAEKTKRAVMMIPLLPIEFITSETINMILWRWRSTFPGQSGVFEKLHRHLMKNYVGATARFPVYLWCVCGRSTRTNNAAESLHAVLNKSVRVRGVVTLDMFLFAIEGQMRNTKREIDDGCPSHSKAIYKSRSSLLAFELSEFFNGKQWILKYLDHCSEILKIKNNTAINLFRIRRNGETHQPIEVQWISRNHLVVEQAAVHLHAFLCPSSSKTRQEILASVNSWAYQRENCQVDLHVVEENSTLSIAAQSVV